MLGKKKSAEEIEQMRQRQLGKPISEESKRKISNAMRGRRLKITDEDRERRRNHAKKLHKYRSTDYFRTDEYREKQRVAHLGVKKGRYKTRRGG